MFNADVQLPEKRKLPVLLKVPIHNNVRPPYFLKRVIDLRGPELVHNQFLLKQYGIVVGKLHFFLLFFNFNWM